MLYRAVPLFLAAAALSTACAGQPPVESMQSAGTEFDELVTRSSIPDLVTASDVILVGVVKGESGIRNMARNSNDPRQEDPIHRVIGQDYLIQVEQVIKGAAPERTVLTIAKAHGDVRATTPDADFIPLQTGQRYLLFLRHQIDGTPGFVPAPEPFRFVLNTSAVAESRWPLAPQFFPARPSARFLNEVAAAAGR